MDLSFETAYALLRRIDKYTATDFDALGIDQQHFELVAQTHNWGREQIPPVMRTMNALLFGTLELLAMPKIIVPAEYVAAVITATVAPSNVMTCCIWMSMERQTGAGALEMSARSQSTSQISPCSADQLFALCCQLAANTSYSDARKRMRVHLGLAVDKLTQEGEQIETNNRQTKKN